jgi:RHH-type proline utilization regulon transcriptional repressor/proline dehydrogenase/delta 1-pyrroline-5-carboxylate dehydrogenase
MMVRLVKGAYWDTEIKRAQERGLDGYPVFTRKAMTDLNYIACAQKLLALRPRIFPQFATHNALTVATILELAGTSGGYEFQRLHGMGDALYEQLGKKSRHSLAHLCAGRQPSRSAGLSGAPAAGEWRELIFRGDRRG